MKYVRIQGLCGGRSHIFLQFQMCSLACELCGLVCESFVLAYLEILLSFVRKSSSSLSSPLVLPSGSISPSYMVVYSSSDLAFPTRIIFEVLAITLLINCASTNWA